MDNGHFSDIASVMTASRSHQKLQEITETICDTRHTTRAHRKQKTDSRWRTLETGSKVTVYYAREKENAENAKSSVSDDVNMMKICR